MQNAFIESFNGSFRDELLNETLFLIADRGPREDHGMEGGLQPRQTPFIPRQSHAAGVCIEINTGNLGRMKPEINRRTLQTAGGKSGLRSSVLTLSNRRATKPALSYGSSALLCGLFHIVVAMSPARVVVSLVRVSRCLPLVDHRKDKTSERRVMVRSSFKPSITASAGCLVPTNDVHYRVSMRRHDPRICDWKDRRCVEYNES